MDVSSGLLTSDELCRRSEMASLNDETKPAQDSVEPSTPREKLKEQGITEHEQVLHAALAQSSGEPNRMHLSTCNSEGQPSSRVVLLKQHDHEKLTFFTNYKRR